MSERVFGNIHWSELQHMDRPALALAAVGPPRAHPDVVGDLNAALAELPTGWWYSLGFCTVSCDASIGPDFRNPDCPADQVERFDGGFHVDMPNPSTLADALRHAIGEAKAALIP